MTPDELAPRLQPVVARALGDDELRLEGLVRLSGGASRETWSFRAVGGKGARPLILQRQRTVLTRPGFGMAVEADAMRAAAAAGVPVPAVLASSADADELGAPYLVAEHVAGETIARKIQRDPEFAAAHARFAADCGRALARLHGIDADTLPELVLMDQLGHYRTVLDQIGEPSPAFELGFRWLEANRPPPGPLVVVHGDFRLGNVMMGPEGLRAVLDWELVHVGNPMEDLGWLCVKAWRFGGGPRVGGLGSVDDLIGAYEDESGGRVDAEVVRWYEVLGTLKWGIMCMLQAATHLTGIQRSVELAAIGRRVCENEHDLLELLP